jgi:hypothetical protein
MTPVVQDFLTTFDRLTDSARIDLASQILHFPDLCHEIVVKRTRLEKKSHLKK